MNIRSAISRGARPVERCRQVEILLIEDSACDAELTMHALEKGGLTDTVLWVDDGSQALDYLFMRNAYAGREDVVPKLVLLDLWLPRLDGIEVLKQMRAHERLRNIPIIVMTSSPEEMALVKRYGLGVECFVEKPVEFAAVAETARQAGCFRPASGSPCAAAGTTMPKYR